MTRKMFSWLIPVMGFLFLTAYIRSATVDVVYTDYIRLANSYMNDVYSLTPYIRADVLTRMPINYIERIINVVLFGYSTTFDMILGAGGLTCAAFVVSKYMNKKNMSYVMMLIVMVVIFSLSKWEMLTNGTGWVHFLAFFCFFYHYLVYDRVRCGEAHKGDSARLILIPWITIIFIAGPYCAIYSLTMLLFYGLEFIDFKSENRAKTSTIIIRALCIIIPLLLYIWSQSRADNTNNGATTLTIAQVVAQWPAFIPSLIVKAFASDVIGRETYCDYGMTSIHLYIIGAATIAMYAYALWITIKEKLYKTTIFPAMLVCAGIMNHLIVCASRWIFLDDTYAMSSRYALQFQIGIIGVLLTYGLVIKKKSYLRAIIPICAFVMIGTLMTNGDEINMAKYRKEYAGHVKEVALNYKDEDDKTLIEVIQYYDPDKTRSALGILEDHGYNIFERR